MSNELGQLLEAHLLAIVVIGPVATAFALGAVAWALRALSGGDLPAGVWRGVGLSSAIATFVATLWAAFRFEPETLGLQALSLTPWFPARCKPSPETFRMSTSPKSTARPGLSFTTKPWACTPSTNSVV